MNYNLFGANTGLKASQLILGAASFGTRSGYGATPGEAMKILTSYAEAGGNFIDTADRYQLGESEEIVGKFIEHQRSNFILSTKYTRSSDTNPGMCNYGNHRKAMRQAVESSLKRLRTDYIDLYMPHFDDGYTPLDEIARGLEDLVTSGKILYTGIANFPAWKISAIAGLSKLNAIQIEYNLVQRTADREFLPMAKQLGLATMMYSPLAGGLLTGKYRLGENGRLNQSAVGVKENETTTKLINLLTQIAGDLNVQAGQVALAWVLSKGAFPIIGARTLQHLNDALTIINLSVENITSLDEISAISLGYPHDLLSTVQG
ncbi:aldo/keto reductase [Pedobacter sp. AW31-3R]|uniref:aldo/keto reductase n=1 Tax=Pedobacter sp. AW31-3R TaxID=3445781 RepID=UPI003FA05C87